MKIFQRKGPLWKKISIGVIVLGGVGGVFAWQIDRIAAVLIYQKPVHVASQLQAAIAKADRIVVRDGGFDCHPIDHDAVLFEIRNPSEIAEVRARLDFLGVTISNSFQEACMCCGSPSLDWYQGENRIALTSLQHGRHIRWAGFSTARVFGIRFGYGDAPLSEPSARWVGEWLSRHTGNDFTLKPPQKPQIVVFEGKSRVGP